MAKVSINRGEVERLTRELQQEFDKHPIRVSVQADSPGPPLGHAGDTNIYNGPVIFGSADGAQLAWGNRDVYQSRSETQQIAPGFEAIAQAVAATLQQLPNVGLADHDRQDAEIAATDILAEVTQPEPDRGKIRRALATLKGVIAPLAIGLATGSAEGAACEWARKVIELLGKAF